MQFAPHVAPAPFGKPICCILLDITLRDVNGKGIFMAYVHDAGLGLTLRAELQAKLVQVIVLDVLESRGDTSAQLVAGEPQLCQVGEVAQL